MGESLGPRRFTFPQSIKNIKPERETFSNYSNKKNQKIFSTLIFFKLYYSQRDFIKKKNGIFRSGPTGLEYGEAFHHESP